MSVVVITGCSSGFGYQAALWWLLDLSWPGWVLAHFLFALHWSSFQYVDHAWSPRDVVEGALDPRAPFAVRDVRGRQGHPPPHRSLCGSERA